MILIFDASEPNLSERTLRIKITISLESSEVASLRSKVLEIAQIGS